MKSLETKPPESLIKDMTGFERSFPALRDSLKIEEFVIGTTSLQFFAYMIKIDLVNRANVTFRLVFTSVCFDTLYNLVGFFHY